LGDLGLVLDVRPEHLAQQWRKRRYRLFACDGAPWPCLIQDLIDGMQEQPSSRASCAPDAAVEVLPGAPVASAAVTCLCRTHGKASLNPAHDGVVGRWSDQHSACRHFDNQVTEHPDGPTVGSRHKTVEHLAQRTMQARGKLIRQALKRNGGFTPDV